MSARGQLARVRPPAASASSQRLLTLHADDADRFERALADLDGGVEIADAGTVVQRLPLVLERIGG